MINSIYRLSEIFAENRITDLSSLHALSSNQRKRLDSSIYGWFPSFKTEHIHILADTPGLNLCLGLRNNIDQYILDDSMPIVVKKLAFLSQTGVLLTPSFHHPNSCRKTAIPEIWYQLVLEHMPLIEAGMLAILPKGTGYLVRSEVTKTGRFAIRREGVRRPRVVERTLFKLEEEIPSLKVIHLSEKSLRRSFQEHQPRANTFSGASAYVYLPQFRNIPSDLLIDLRRHHTDLFDSYNRAIQSFLAETSKAQTEKRLLEAIQKTDAEIRRIDTEMKRIARTRTITAAGIGLRMTAIVLYASYQPSLAAILAILAGSNIISGSCEYIRLGGDKKALQNDTPFYFPWLLHDESKKFAGDSRATP